MSQRDDSLAGWQAQVEAFGGRLGRGEAETLWQELEASNLGSEETLPTLLPTADMLLVIPRTVVLAEMKLTRPIAVDVSFNYFNNEVVPQGDFGSNGMQLGDGFVRVTWGIPGGVQKTADIDGNLGWRFPFVASYLRVEYFPFGLFQEFAFANNEWQLPGGQIANLGLSAMIAPASGAPCLPLTKTIFMKNTNGVAPTFSALGIVPKWANNFHFNCESTTPAIYKIGLFEAQPQVLNIEIQEVFSDNTANGWPDWVARSHKYPIPQGSTFLIVFPQAGTTLRRLTAVCELAL